MMTSKQPKDRQGITGVSTRSGPMKTKSGLVKMIQGAGYIENTENS